MTDLWTPVLGFLGGTLSLVGHGLVQRWTARDAWVRQPRHDAYLRFVEAFNRDYEATFEHHEWPGNFHPEVDSENYLDDLRQAVRHVQLVGTKTSAKAAQQALEALVTYTEKGVSPDSVYGALNHFMDVSKA